MSTTVKFPETASVYELVRTRPGAMERLQSVGVTREYFSFRIEDAARAVGVPVERLAEIADELPMSAS
ncbi:MAG: hypothetical protein ABIQ47_18075 [Tepidiformaceae bacterium]